MLNANVATSVDALQCDSDIIENAFVTLIFVDRIQGYLNLVAPVLAAFLERLKGNSSLEFINNWRRKLRLIRHFRCHQPVVRVSVLELIFLLFFIVFQVLEKHHVFVVC